MLKLLVNPLKKKTKKKRKIPKKYLPNNLSQNNKKTQLKSILKGTERPELKSYKSKRSGWVKKFEKKYNKKITDKKWIHKNIIKEEGQKLIIDKGKAAYYTSGSRPNQTPYSWAYGRLAGVILNSPARKIDINIWNKYKI